MLIRVHVGIRLNVPLGDVDGIEKPVVGYYRSYFFDVADLVTAIQLALRDANDGNAFDLTAEVTELARVDPEIVAMMKPNESGANILWKSGRVLFPEDDRKPRPWYRRIFH